MKFDDEIGGDQPAEGGDSSDGGDMGGDSGEGSA